MKTSLKHRSTAFPQYTFPLDMSSITTIVLGGGRGTRLFPLTQRRCKPALSFGGRFHLIDVPISNAINSGCKKIYIITQFLSSSLHQHIFKTYRHGFYLDGFIEMLPAEEKPSHKEWFQGTADAVRQNLHYLQETPAEYFLILSGDQLYRLNFQHLLQFAKETDADVVIASIPCSKEAAKRMGILKIDSHHFITEFSEKPQNETLLKRLIYSQKHQSEGTQAEETKNCPYLGSMGIYLFKRKALFDLLIEDKREDFGKHLIPTIVAQGKAAAFIFQGYWEDVGTIRSFYEANMALTQEKPPFDCYNEIQPIFSDLPHLPGARISHGNIRSSIICEGCLVEAKKIHYSILGPRSVIKKGTVIENSYLMGNTFYTPPTGIQCLPRNLCIEEDCYIRSAILDENVHLGRGVKLLNEKGLQNYDGEEIFIRDGIIVVPRGVSLPDNFIL